MGNFKDTYMEQAKILGKIDISQFAQNQTDKIKRFSGNLWKLLGGKSREYLFSFMNKWIIDTKHSSERIYERNELTVDEIKKMFINMIKGFLSSKFSDDSGEYLIFSRALKQGVVVDYREDNKGAIKGNHFVIITFLPRNKSNPKEGTQKLIVESTGEYSSEFVDYVSYLVENHSDEAFCESERQYDYNPKDIMIEGTKITPIFCENKLHDFSNLTVVEVD